MVTLTGRKIQIHQFKKKKNQVIQEYKQAVLTSLLQFVGRCHCDSGPSAEV